MAHLTREEIVKSGEVAPEFEEAFTTRPLTLDTGTILSHRLSRAAHLAKLRHLYPIPGPIPEVLETDYQVPVRDGTKIRVRVYQPAKGEPEGGSPLVVMFHEGGWCMGDLTDEEMDCRMLSTELGVVGVNVEYRLAPEHPFPIPTHDSYDALKWALSNATMLKATPSAGVIVGGASAGGNIAAVLACLARDEKLEPPVTGQYLVVPALLPEGNVPERFREEYRSRSESVRDPVIGRVDEGGLREIYKPSPTSPLWDPFNHPAGHTGLPKAYFQVAGLDPLRDEAVLYERVLRDSGVETKLDLYKGYGHMFWTNWPELQRSREFWADMVEGVRWLLGGE